MKHNVSIINTLIKDIDSIRDGHAIHDNIYDIPSKGIYYNKVAFTKRA